MKLSLFISGLLMLFSQLKGQYNGFHFTLSITDIKGNTTKGYAYIASLSFEMDSVNKTAYLKWALDQDCDANNGFTYFEERITYRYKDHYTYMETKKKSRILYLTGKRNIPTKQIRRIKIIKTTEQETTYGIERKLTMQDTSWMNKDPVKHVRCGAYLCSFDIFVHQNSEKVDLILKQIKIKQKKYERRVKEAEERGEEFDTQDGDKTDREFEQLLKKLDGEKVVVIWYCTC